VAELRKIGMAAVKPGEDDLSGVDQCGWIFSGWQLSGGNVAMAAEVQIVFADDDGPKFP